MLKTIIIDDEPKSIDSIKFVLSKRCPDINVVETARSAAEAYSGINLHKPDMVFLDVEMPYEDGFELLNKFIGHSFEVIFVTAYENFAAKAFKVNAIDYVLKPFTENDIVNAVKKASERIQEKRLIYNSDARPVQVTSKRMAVPSFDGLLFLNVEDIIRCEASESYTYFYLKNKEKILVCKSLSEYEDMLAAFDFHRIHQSHLVNLAYVEKYVRGRGGYVVMQDGTNLDVSVRKKIEFLENIFK